MREGEVLAQLPLHSRYPRRRRRVYRGISLRPWICGPRPVVRVVQGMGEQSDDGVRISAVVLAPVLLVPRGCRTARRGIVVLGGWLNDSSGRPRYDLDIVYSCGWSAGCLTRDSR